MEERLQQYRNEKNRYLNQSSPMKKSSNVYDPNQNNSHNLDGNKMTATLSSSVTNISQPNTSSYHHHHHHQSDVSGRFSMENANGVNNNKSIINGDSNALSSTILHPALLNIINDTHGLNFRG